MYIHLTNPTCHARGGSCSLCSLHSFGGSFTQGGGLRAFRARSGVVRPSRGSLSISSSFGGRSTKLGVSEHFELVRGSFDQAGGLRPFRARSEVAAPKVVVLDHFELVSAVAVPRGGRSTKAGVLNHRGSAPPKPEGYFNPRRGS